MTLIKQDTEAARDHSIEQLRQKKIADYMDQHGVSRAEAERAVGNVVAGTYKAATAVDTVNAIIEAEAGGASHSKIAKLMTTPVGADLYALLGEAQADLTTHKAGAIDKQELINTWNGLIDSNLEKHNGDRWRTANAILKTRIGAELYRRITG
jgi:hypothetical protein